MSQWACPQTLFILTTFPMQTRHSRDNYRIMNLNHTPSLTQLHIPSGLMGNCFTANTRVLINLQLHLSLHRYLAFCILVCFSQNVLLVLGTEDSNVTAANQVLVSTGGQISSCFN